MVSHLTKETKVWAPLALIVVVGVALSICASVVSAGFNAAQTRAEFERQASGEIAALKVSIAASLNAVNSLSALYQARGTAARDEFQRFAETILASDPSIQALEWARVVVHDQRADVERGLAEESGRAIHFTERNGRGELVTAGERPRYVPVIYITPPSGNERALAFDLASEQTRQAAILEAERTGAQVVSARIMSLQQANDYSVLVFQPTFALSEAPKRMAGLVLGLFRIRDMIAAASVGRESFGVHLVLLDRSAPTGEQLLYPMAAGDDLLERARQSGISSDVPVGGRQWTIVALPAKPDHAPGAWLHYAVLVVGLLLTGNLAFYVLQNMRRRQSVEREVRLRTRELEASEARFGALCSTAQDAIVTINEAGEIGFWNRSAERIFGYNAAEAVGKKVHDFLAPQRFRERAARGQETFVATGKGDAIGKTVELAALRKDGGEILIELSLAGALRDGHREAIGILRDITERRAAEDRLQFMNVLLTAQMEAYPDGILVVGPDRHIISHNQRFADIWKIPLETLSAGSDDSALVAALPLVKDPQEFLGVVSHLYDHPDATNNDEFELADGRFIDRRTVTLRAPDGHNLGRIWFFRDITKSKESEQALRAARDEADRSASAKADFLAMMSHEIRSPMSGLLGVIELLRDTSLDAEQEQMVGVVHGSAGSLMRVLNDVLDFTKIEAGAVQLALEPVDLRSLVAELIATLAPNAEGTGLSLAGDVADEVPGYISTDPVRLRQILTNLLGNAIKFTASGSVRLEVTCTTLGGAPRLVLAVRDTGIGIAGDVIDRLFEPFSQADASTTRIFGGTGLGLTISRRLARLLGGDIEVASELGHGSVFTAAVPLVSAQCPVIATARDAHACDASLEGMRILVAEDQVTNRWLIRRQLERLGGMVTDVEDGRAALAAFNVGRYDLVITDCHMPGIDGLELVRLIRCAEASDGADPLPILGLTADVTPEMRERCLTVGMNNIVAKPIDLIRLHAAIVLLTSHASAGAIPDEASRDAELFDPSMYEQLFADDVAEGHEWLGAYLASAAQHGVRIEQAAAGGNRSELRAAAHTLAGSSLSVGAMRLGTLARRVETVAPNASEEEVHELADEVILAMRSAREAIICFMATPALVA